MAFATVSDVQTRLARDLSDAESDAAEFLLDAVTAEIETVTGRLEADIDDPGILRFVSVEAVCRELASPIGAEATAETLGAYSYNVKYRETGETMLTRSERAMARRGVLGSPLISPKTPPPIEEDTDYAIGS